MDGLGKRRKTSQSEDVSVTEKLVIVSSEVHPSGMNSLFSLYYYSHTHYFVSPKEDVSRSCREERPSVPAVQSERKMDCAAAGNHNKVKVMATQLLAKFEENAPAQSSGLKRQVCRKHAGCVLILLLLQVGHGHIWFDVTESSV